MTVTIPKGNGVRAMGDVHDGRPVLVVFPEADTDEWTVIDAETGAVGPPRPDDDPQREKEAEIQAAAATATICPLDPKTAPWPYTGDPPEVPRYTFQDLSYIEPDPASGVRIGHIVGDCPGGCPDGGTGIVVENARSEMGVAANDSGEILANTSEVDPVDLEAFQRYLTTVQAVPAP